MNAEINLNNQLADKQLKILDKIQTKFEEEVAEKSCFCKCDIELSIQEDDIFIKKMFLEGWTDLGRDIIVEYYDMPFLQMLDDFRGRVENYDVSYETYIWLDDEGHGKNGAPYDMFDCYKDSEEELERLEELEYLLKNLDKTIKNDYWKEIVYSPFINV